MTAQWSVPGLLAALAARHEHPAVIASGEAGLDVRSCAGLAADAEALARGLRAIAPAGSTVAIWAPNGVAWIASALAVVAAGNVLAPVDDLADAAQFATAVQTSNTRLVLTVRRHYDTAVAATAERGLPLLLLDDNDPGSATSWRRPMQPGSDPLPVPSAAAPAVLCWTSGTTGSPKAFHLSHGNIAANVEAVVSLHLIGPQDRALLPLPLHHAYPLIVGALTTLTHGTAIVLPADASGPAILKALRDGEVTTIIGVPRLYEAMLAALDLRLATRRWPVRLLGRLLLQGATALQRKTGVALGRPLFAPIRHGIAPSLRLLVSGGARLDEATADRLEALGWTVLSGYGLAETASLFTGNRPGAKRRGSTGRPLAGGEVRIANPDAGGVGEIELRGPSVTAGYLDNPEANRASFTPDNWFRTGDLGRLDDDGFLFVTGRTKEVLVLGGGKKVNPEDLERVYGAAPQIREIAVLEEGGGLVALVRPEAAKLREMGAKNPRDAVRVALIEAGQPLPSYQRLAGFALTEQPLPRTRLGKIRRFLLPALYAESLAGRSTRAEHPLSADDVALLADPSARAVWEFLRQRFPEAPIGLDTSLALELAIDSFGWVELAIALEDRQGLHLSDADIAGIETVRDLLRCAVARRAEGAAAAADGTAPTLAEDIERWIAPTGILLTALGAILFGLNRLAMRGLFRLRVQGLEHLPAEGPFVITPNHVSDIDPLVVAAALSFARLRRTYWAGDMVRLFYNALARLFCRAMHIVPVDELHPGAAVRMASRVLERGMVQVWFPEGWRSPDGRLQRFMPGIGQLLLRAGVPAIPVWIGGAFEAMPRNRRVPRLRPLSVRFGPAVDATTLLEEGSGPTDQERVAKALHARVLRLAEPPEADVSVLSAS